MAVLVAGVGYIGARLVERLLERGEEVLALDNFFSTDVRALERLRQQPGFALLEGSITNRRDLRAAFSSAPISVVYLLAAQASAHPEAASVRYTETVNLLGPRLVLDCMREHSVARIVYASSFKVYGSYLPSVVAEDASYGQFGDFSHLSKCYVEKLLEMYALREPMTCLPVRLGITYGVSPVMKRDYRFITAPNKFCLQAVRGEVVELHLGSERPAGFIHVTDAADVVIAAAESKISGYVPINAVTEVCSVAEVGWTVRRTWKRGKDEEK
jgi:nucleoside-diphosphate-sugar epimerase